MEPPVSDEYWNCPIARSMPVERLILCSKFISFSHGLDDRVSINFIQQVIQRDEVHLVIALLRAPAGGIIAFSILRVSCKGKARTVTCGELVFAFQQEFWFEVCVEVVKKFLESIIEKRGALLIKGREQWRPGIEVKIFKQFMVDGTALHENLEMEERIERDFPVTGKINSWALAEILTMPVHLFNFRQQDLFDFFRADYSCHRWSKAIVFSD